MNDRTPSPTEEARKRLAEIPAGPWERDGSWISSPEHFEMIQVDGVYLNRTVYSPLAEFIVASPRLLAALADREELLEAAIRAEHERAERLTQAVAFTLEVLTDDDMPAYRANELAVELLSGPSTEGPTERSPRERWGTCCPFDPECDHSFIDSLELSKWMDQPISDEDAAEIEGVAAPVTPAQPACPTCGSDDPAKRHRLSNPSHLAAASVGIRPAPIGCANPWHSAPSTGAPE